jgi:hypothetical protein
MLMHAVFYDMEIEFSCGKAAWKKKGGKQRIEEHNLKDELTLMVSEKRRASCICTSSRVLLIPATPTPPLLPNDPTASTIAANRTNSSVALLPSSWCLFDHKARCTRYRRRKDFSTGR